MSGSLLENINTPDDVKALTTEDLDVLCGEIRETLLGFAHTHGGHIGSNLGVVELTVALHRVFDSPRDSIIFDVSHQSYVHKMLTGRQSAYRQPENFPEITGFTNPNESEHDHFVVGHTGTSISLACGMAKARDLEFDATHTSHIRNVIAVIGDGALSSAVALEGLNNAAAQGGNLIIVVNDNEMSIAENVGGMYATLSKLRESNGMFEPNIFKAFGLEYRYVEQGNNVHALVEAFEEVKNTTHPVVLHIHTIKGLGLDTGNFAQSVSTGRCEANHWIDPDGSQTGVKNSRKYYGELAMRLLQQRFDCEPGLVVISPATPGSNGITADFRKTAGNHYVDTGIAEEHAAAYAAGIAKAGGTPVLATSATFFQRSFDQLQQELSLNANPVTLLVFSAGLSHADNTHSGAFDIAMFSNIPQTICLAPTNERQFIDMLQWSTQSRDHGTVVIRVPGTQIYQAQRSKNTYPIFTENHHQQQSADTLLSNGNNPFSNYRTTHAGSEVALIALSNTYPLAEQTAQALRLRAKNPIDATIIDPQQFSTIDTNTLEQLRAKHSLVITLEDGQLEGGWGEKITAYYANHSPLQKAQTMRVLNIGAKKEFTDRVALPDLEQAYGLTVNAIVGRIAALQEEA